MAAQNEIQFAISLKNEASATLAQFKADAQSAMEAAGTATNKYGQSTQNLTKWIKEQRTEQRQHNFLFQQTREVVGAASLTLALFGNTIGRGSQQMQELTNGLNAGFVAFQGVNNVVGLLGSSMKFLAGPWGIVISLAAGAAVALSQFSSEAGKSSEELTKLRSTANQLDYELGKISASMRKAFLLKDIADANSKVDELKQTTTDWIKTVATQGRFGLVRKIVGTPEEIAAAENDVRNAEKAFKSFYDEQKKATQKQKEYNDELAIMRGNLSVYDEARTRAFSFLDGVSTKYQTLVSKMTTGFGPNSVKGIMRANQQTASEYLKLWDETEKAKLAAREAALEQESQLVESYGQTSMQVFQLVGSALGNAFAGQDQNARAVLKSIAGMFITMAESALFAASAMASAKSIATFWTSMAKDAPLLIAGFAALETARAVVNSFHDGGTMGSMGERIPLRSDERPAILKVGETVIPTKPGESIGGGGNTFIFNNYAPVTAEDWVVSTLKTIVQKTGIPIERLIVSSRSTLAIG